MFGSNLRDCEALAAFLALAGNQLPSLIRMEFD